MASQFVRGTRSLNRRMPSSRFGHRLLLSNGTCVAPETGFSGSVVFALMRIAEISIVQHRGPGSGKEK